MVLAGSTERAVKAKPKVDKLVALWAAIEILATLTPVDMSPPKAVRVQRRFRRARFASVLPQGEGEPGASRQVRVSNP